MMPKMGTIIAGLIKIAQASLTQSKLISGVTSLTKLDDTDNVTLKDVLMSASIDNGRFNVKPFDVKFGSYATNIAGSTGLNGSIDYTLKMNVPLVWDLAAGLCQPGDRWNQRLQGHPCYHRRRRNVQQPEDVAGDDRTETAG